MYGRKIGGKILNFEASGGLSNASLVMQDKQTDSYWSLMKSEAVAGTLVGSKLHEIASARKALWKDWRREHPDTLVLSVAGKQHAPHNPYLSYFSSEVGFRGLSAGDQRLATKQPIFAFQQQGKRYAVPFEALTGGRSFELEVGQVFLYRRQGAGLFESTAAWWSESGFALDEASWTAIGSGCLFDPAAREFQASGKNAVEICPKPLAGFDTFWYNWSLNNPDTLVLGKNP